MKANFLLLCFSVLSILQLALAEVASDGTAPTTPEYTDDRFSTATSHTARPTSDSTTKFTLIRVAPFSGTNPFDYRAVRLAIDEALTPGSGETPGGGTLCTPGPLSASGFPLIAFSDGYVDVVASSNSMTGRDSGSVGSNTVLVASKPDTVNTTFAAASGWQAITPSLPATYLSGPVGFVLRRSDSGDYYSLQVSIQPGSMVHLSNPSGSCCGQGGCP